VATLLDQTQSVDTAEKRRVLATRMLLRLIERHASAARNVEDALESMANIGLPYLAVGVGPQCYSIGRLFSDIAHKVSAHNTAPPPAPPAHPFCRSPPASWAWASPRARASCAATV